MEEIVEINGIWGKYDIFLKVSHNTSIGLNKVVETLRRVENITSTYTLPVLFGQDGSIDD